MSYVVPTFREECIRMVWFGCIARLSQWGRRGILRVQMGALAVPGGRGGVNQRTVPERMTLFKASYIFYYNFEVIHEPILLILT